MKIYSPPKEIKTPQFEDFHIDDRFNFEKEEKAIQQFKVELKRWLETRGYTGLLTGEIVYFPFADSHAQYMVADGKTMALVHLPVGDAWQISAAHARGLRASDIRQMLRK